MLHDAYTQARAPEVSILSVTHKAGDQKAILLATAWVAVDDRFGNTHHTRALIDQGSEVLIVTEAFVQQLRLQRSRSDVSIIGVGGTHSGSTRGKVTLNVTSSTTGTEVTAVAFVLPRLSLYDGSSSRHRTDWPHIRGLQLADPQFYNGDSVELLLGAEVCSRIFEDGLRKGGPHDPIAQKTTLGWILSGGRSTTSSNVCRGSFACKADQELESLVRLFWEQEREPAALVSLSPEEKRCEEIFARTHRREADGRYVVRLPFSTTPDPSIGETKKSAERSMAAMERKCAQNSHFGDLYRQFMRDYQNLGHMEIVSEPAARVACYLPHHGVLREASASTKLRVVFNGSQRIPSGESLNKHLLVGANLLPTLADILLRWRLHRYALVTDVEKMYRQIAVHPDDRDFQRILWRHQPTDRMREFRLTTVTYGLACAPFLAIRTLRQFADDDGTRYLRGAKALRQDCYVDDIVTGANTKLEAISMQSELRDLCMTGGFPL